MKAVKPYLQEYLKYYMGIYSSFSEEYQSALVFAVPYEEQLTLDRYTEEEFEQSIQHARKNRLWHRFII